MREGREAVHTTIAIRASVTRKAVRYYLSIRSLVLIPRRWQREASTFLLTQEVVIEKVGIQQGLQDSAKVHEPVIGKALFRLRSIDPIENVESSVRAHEENEIPRQVFHFPVSLQDNELWQDCD